MLKKLFATDEDVSNFILRLLLGIVFFPHGMQKLFGWFGGPGFGGTMDMFTQGLGIPAVLALCAILAEGVGALGLLGGLLTRVSAFGLAVNMIVATFMLHLQNGFFMNWSGKQGGEGFEYHILVVAIALVLMIKGGGKWSLDGIVAKKLA